MIFVYDLDLSVSHLLSLKLSIELIDLQMEFSTPSLSKNASKEILCVDLPLFSA